ncbi:MAG: M14 family metallocarboxypeptidase [Verrucomicrobiota bacterium]
MSRSFHWPDFLPAFERAAARAGFAPTILATTAAGPLVVWERPGGGPHVYLSAGIHGDEPAGPLALLELLDEGWFTRDLAWSICPALNPTGLAAGRRENAGGIDLNRDYWLLRSEEVAAHAAWLATHSAPGLFLSLHEDWETQDFYLYEINLGSDAPQRARDIIAAVQPWFPPQAGPEIDGHLPRGPGWIFHAAEADVPDGWPEAIFLARHGCPLSFTFETPSHAALPVRISAQRAAVRAACRHLTDQLRQG